MSIGSFGAWIRKRSWPERILRGGANSRSLMRLFQSTMARGVLKLGVHYFDVGRRRVFKWAAVVDFIEGKRGEERNPDRIPPRRPPNAPIPAENGGDGWESNPPRTLSALMRF